MTFPNPTRDELPLAGVKVLDLSRVLAGPLCAQHLGDMGADVIKVEAVGAGDETRGWPPFRNGQGAVYLSANRNKRSIALDLKQKEAQRIVFDLAKTADVVIENFGQSVARRLGVGYDDLKPANRRMVYCAISGFGDAGPMRDDPAYDVVLQAFSGMMSLTGEKGRPDIRSPISPVDQTTGVNALAGVLAALYRVQRTGQGALVRVSLLESALGLLGYQLQTYWETRQQPEKLGSRHHSLCPYQVFNAKDGPFLLGISNEGQWRRFCEAAREPELATRPGLATNADRVARYDETVAVVQEILLRKTGAEWLVVFSPARVPCAPIHTLPEVVQSAQARALDILLSYDHPKLGELNAVGLPIRFDEQQRTVHRAPPEHGAHSKEILAELGYTDAEIRSLYCANAVAGLQ